ncbi:MAG: lamin tail domain-containing protein, partial [Bacteroidota bacterium]|nr:lamin tail domain-containing protein [Bacteroidota bacterium]
MKKFLFLFSLLSITFSLNSQNIVINEFLTSNTNDIQDNYGEFEDWIEIYNPASTAYNIAGLFFTDDLLVPLKYQIPVG